MDIPRFLRYTEINCTDVPSVSMFRLCPRVEEMLIGDARALYTYDPVTCPEMLRDFVQRNLVGRDVVLSRALSVLGTSGAERAHAMEQFWAVKRELDMNYVDAMVVAPLTDPGYVSAVTESAAKVVRTLVVRVTSGDPRVAAAVAEIRRRVERYTAEAAEPGARTLDSARCIDTVRKYTRVAGLVLCVPSPATVSADELFAHISSEMATVSVRSVSDVGDAVYHDILLDILLGLRHFDFEANRLLPMLYRLLWPA